MCHILLKAGAVFAIGSFAFAAPTLALVPPAASGPASLVVPVQDEENAEVWHDLRPDVTPPPAAVGKEGENEKEAPKGSAAEPPMGQGSGDVENQELWHDLETGVTPPPGE